MLTKKYIFLLSATVVTGAISIPSADAAEFHDQTTHIWFTASALGGGLELLFDFGQGAPPTGLWIWRNDGLPWEKLHGRSPARAGLSIATSGRARALADADDDAVADDGDFLAQCLKMGKQQLLQGRVFSAESISKPLYQNGLQLARYRGLLKANRAAERSAFHQEFRRITDRLDEILGITLAKAD